MGAKQRAQKRGKKAAKGSMKGAPMSQKQLNKSIQVPSLDSMNRAQALQSWQAFARNDDTGFTMSQEARNTGRHVFGWSSTPLRNNNITFVSAGTLTREEPVEDGVEDDNEAEIEQDVVNHEEEPQESDEAEVETAEDVVASIEVESVPMQEHTTIVEHVNAEPMGNGANNALPTHLSEDSSESEEEIVFTGRQNSAQPSRRETPKPEVTTKAEVGINVGTKPVPIPVRSQHATDMANSAPSAIEGARNGSRSSGPSITLKRHMLRGYNDKDAIMQDYIDNMVLDDSDENPHATRRHKKNEHFRFHKGSGEENAKVQMLSHPHKSEHDDYIDQAIDWDSDDLADFDDLSTTDEEVDEVSQVLRHRERPSGPQYLVVGSGREASDAKWILHEKLASESAVAEIKIYEDIRNMNIEEEEDDDSDSSDGEEEEALQDLIDNIASEDDENERIFRHTNRMTDEQIAQALAKQEELGMGSDELLLLNGEVGVEEDMDEDVFGLEHDFIAFSSQKKTPRGRRNRKQRDSFPSAEAFADALEQDPYGAFDIMDFDRPSLRPKKKGRKSDYPDYLDSLEDEDLKHQLVSTWTKDREKKATRKREKEEARLVASLDAADGSDPAVIKLRIRQFLVQDIDTLKLSPMESATRAAVHRLAKALKLNSRSEGREGVGLGRYPVLTKTARTPAYTVHTIWEIDAMMNTKRFFPKHSFKSSKMPRGTGGKLRRGGGGVMSGATYRDGEEVAASAPEIGVENRGRAMLEKMGWTAGMGIGAVGNKGGLDPIRHIVKTTKAGLG